MNELIIDTATNLLLVAVKKDNLIFEKCRIGKNDNAEYVVEYIKLCLEEANLTIDNIDTIIVGVGPGSYTGIRNSVVVAKTLASTKKINLKTISSLNLLSSGYNLVSPAIDARRNHFFAATYQNGVAIKDDQYISKNDLNNFENVVYLTTENIKLNYDVISKNAIECHDIHNLEPNYLRKTEAETNYDQKNGNN